MVKYPRRYPSIQRQKPYNPTSRPQKHIAKTVSEQKRIGEIGEELGEKGVLGPKSHLISSYLSEPPPAEEPVWVYLNSSRVSRAYYDKETKVIAVTFVDGTPWHYADTTGEIWKRFQRSKSPGRFVNRVLNNFPYGVGHY